MISLGLGCRAQSLGEFMNKKILKLSIFVLSLGLFFATAAKAQFDRNLSRQIEILDLIRPTIERIDMARLLVVRNSLTSIQADIKGNIEAGRQPTTFQTLRLIQNLIIQYRYSQTFFGWTQPISMTSVYSPAIAPYLTELQKLAKQTETEFGLDDSPYTQITSNTFRQMQKLLQQLETLAIDANLKAQLRSLWKPLGETIAIAEQGDRPRAFAKAIEVIQQIRTFYPRFDQISATSAGFASILEVQGLTEFYAEFAQIEN